jgi:hypothetical protein
MLGVKLRQLGVPFAKGVWIYCLILWAYIVGDMFVFPQYQFSGISRLIPIPQNLIADLAFPLSFVAFVAWEYLRHQESAYAKGTSIEEEGQIVRKISR